MSNSGLQKPAVYWMTLAGMFFVLLSIVSVQRARSAAPAAAPVVRTDAVKIKKLYGVGKRYKVKTPVFSTSASTSSSRSKEWQQIKVLYETKPEWIDELVFQYHVLTALTERGVRKFSLYRVSVKYMDIARHREHGSTVYLRPSAISRYGEVVAVGVEIKYKGQTVAEEESKGKNIKWPAGKWFRNPGVVDSKAVTRRDGYLLNRAQSPWALVNIDSYEVIKQ